MVRMNMRSANVEAMCMEKMNNAGGSHIAGEWPLYRMNIYIL